MPIIGDESVSEIIYQAKYWGEIISLKWTNFDLDNNLITLDHKNTKSMKTRKIPIYSILRKLLLELKLKSSSSECVFLNTDGRSHLRQDPLNRTFWDTLKRAKIAGLRFHDLRHTAATRMIELGVSIVAVSKILGHADLKTTMRYARPDDSLVDGMEKLANFNKNPSQICSQESH